MHHLQLLARPLMWGWRKTEKSILKSTDTKYQKCNCHHHCQRPYHRHHQCHHHWPMMCRCASFWVGSWSRYKITYALVFITTITHLWCAGVRAFEWALEAERDIDRDIDRDMLGLQHSSQDIVVVFKLYFSILLIFFGQQWIKWKPASMVISPTIV